MKAARLFSAVALFTVAQLPAQGLFEPGPVINLGAPSGSHDGSPALNFDETYMIFASTRPGGLGGFDLYETTRTNANAAWRAPVAIAALNSALDDLHPTLCEVSPNRFELIFSSSRSSAPGLRDLFCALGSPGAWNPPVLLPGNVNNGSLLQTPSLTDDGLTLFYASTATGNGDIHTARRSAVGQPWQAQGAFVPASDPTTFDWSPAPDGNGNILFFARRPSGASDDLWVTSRVDSTGTWTAPIPLVNLNTTALEAAPFRRSITGRIYVTHGTQHGLRLQSHDWRFLYQSIRERRVSRVSPRLNVQSPWSIPILWHRQWTWPRASTLAIENYRDPPAGPGIPLVAVLLSVPPSQAVPSGFAEAGAFMMNPAFVANLGLTLLGSDGLTKHSLSVPNVAALTGQQFGVQSVMLDPNGPRRMPPEPLLIWSEPGIGEIR